MPEIKNHPPGAFCWAEVGTVEPQRTKAFYSELFGWKYEDKPAGQFGVYTMCQMKGKDLAGLYELPPELLKRGVPPHWMPYVSVVNADASCQEIAKHGGKVEQGPFDVMDVGRMAICKDPTDATFSIWQSKAHTGSAVMGDGGTPCWFELATKGVDKAERFYTGVFQWGVKQSNAAGFPYREIHAPGVLMPMGGMMELMPEQGPVPPHWMIYFLVGDCDGDSERAKRLGGKVIVPPMDIPTVGRFSVLADPAGATFSIIKLTFDIGQKHEAAKKTQVSPSKPPAASAKSPKKK